MCISIDVIFYFMIISRTTTCRDSLTEEAPMLFQAVLLTPALKCHIHVIIKLCMHVSLERRTLYGGEKEPQKRTVILSEMH
jgi:hypothetical protein